jgi:hypothetical protein
MIVVDTGLVVVVLVFSVLEGASAVTGRLEATVVVDRTATTAAVVNRLVAPVTVDGWVLNAMVLSTTVLGRVRADALVS